MMVKSGFGREGDPFTISDMDKQLKAKSANNKRLASLQKKAEEEAATREEGGKRPTPTTETKPGPEEAAEAVC